MSSFYIDLLGPIHHCLCKCQTVIAGSSAEAEIYATDECVKFFLEVSQILQFLAIKDVFMTTTNIISYYNQACVQWSKQSTTEGSSKKIILHNANVGHTGQ